MGRKGEGHMPLTHYERTKKFASSNYGTRTTKLSGDSQVTFGHCSLSLTPIMNDDNNRNNKKIDDDDNDKDDDDEARTTTTIAMVTPSGHLYAKEAILDYLLTKTQDYQDQLQAYERQQQEETAQTVQEEESKKRQRQEEFNQSQKASKNSSSNKKMKSTTGNNGDDDDGLKRTSYWLPDMQPAKVDRIVKPPERPTSPYSGNPLRRKDLREVALLRNSKNNSEDVLCAISQKPIKLAQPIAYWTKDKTKPGVVVLKDVYNMTILDTATAAGSDNNKKKGGNTKKPSSSLICPLTNSKIKHTIELKSGGSGFASHNAVEVKTYRPTIT